MRNKGLLSHVNPNKRFKTSSYWGTWNRVLRYPTWYETDKVHLEMVEFSVTPVNGDTPYGWDDVAGIRIRKHGTAISAKDTQSDVIPMEWYQLMGERLGEELRDFMLYKQFDLKEFDWVAYRNLNNGGVPLASIWGGYIPKRKVLT